jgi:hypothetical protein
VRVTLWVGVVCFTIFAGQPAAAGPPFPLRAGLQFDEKSPYAMIVFEAEPQEVVPQWSIEILAFAPDTQTWTYGPLNGWARFADIKPKPVGRQFQAALVKPAGTYAVNNLGTQGHWRTCFNGGTQAFTVAAGKVNYIGVIDPNPSLGQILVELPDKATIGRPMYLWDTPRLKLTPPSQRPGWEADLQSFIAARFPKVSAPIVASEPQAVTFAPGHSRIAGKICQKY